MRRRKLSYRQLVLLIILLTALLVVHRYRNNLYYYWVILTDRTTAGSVYANFGQKTPHGYKVHGVDVSHHQGKIDWELLSDMRSNGDSISFVIIKATEGRHFTDPWFYRNWKLANEHKLIRGAYHYYRPSVNSAHQADKFISSVRLEKGDLPPILDIEDASPFGYDNLRKGISNWLKIIEAEYGVRPIIYTSASFYVDHLSGAEFRDYPLWIAHYTSKRNPAVSKERWLFWQYSDRGLVSGCKDLTDLNVFNGDLAELKSLSVK